MNAFKLGSLLGEIIWGNTRERAFVSTRIVSDNRILAPAH